MKYLTLIMATLDRRQNELNRSAILKWIKFCPNRNIGMVFRFNT